MVMGTRRMAPPGRNSTTAMARGPRFAFLVEEVEARGGPCCAKADVNVRQTASAAHMACRADLRYKYCVMETNGKAPEFTLPDENGNPVSLQQFRGKTVVLFFYPKAATRG